MTHVNTPDPDPWRDLHAGLWSVHYGANCGTYGSLRMIADAAATIREALARIEPVQKGDSMDWTVATRKAALAVAMGRLGLAGLGGSWTVDTMNKACETALAITRGHTPGCFCEHEAELALR